MPCLNVMPNVQMVFLCHKGRSYRWLGEEEVTFSDWRDGEPNQMFGCGHMTTGGQWTVSACDSKLDAAICEINAGEVCGLNTEILTNTFLRLINILSHMHVHICICMCT